MKNKKYLLDIFFFLIIITGAIVLKPLVNQFQIADNVKLFANMIIFLLLLYNFFILKNDTLFLMLLFVSTIIINKLYLGSNLSNYKNYRYFIPYIFSIYYKFSNKYNDESTTTNDKNLPQSDEELKISKLSKLALVLFSIILGVTMCIFLLFYKNFIVNKSDSIEKSFIIILLFCSILFSILFLCYVAYYVCVKVLKLYFGVRFDIKKVIDNDSNVDYASICFNILIAIIYICVLYIIVGKYDAFLNSFFTDSKFILGPIVVLFVFLFVLIIKSTLFYISINIKEIQEEAIELYDKLLGFLKTALNDVLDIPKTLFEQIIDTFENLFDISEVIPKVISSFNTLITAEDDDFKGNKLNKCIVQILKAGVVALSIISFWTTANGLMLFVLDGNYAVAYFISFAIQSTLFSLSIEINFENNKNEILSFIDKKSSIILFCICIITSSFFSFVFFSESIYTKSRDIDSEIQMKEVCDNELVSLIIFKNKTYDSTIEEINNDLEKLNSSFDANTNNSNSNVATNLKNFKDRFINGKNILSESAIQSNNFISVIEGIFNSSKNDIEKSNNIHAEINNVDMKQYDEQINTTNNELTRIQEKYNQKQDENRAEPYGSQRTLPGGDIFNELEELKTEEEAKNQELKTLKNDKRNMDKFLNLLKGMPKFNELKLKDSSDLTKIINDFKHNSTDNEMLKNTYEEISDIVTQNTLTTDINFKKFKNNMDILKELNDLDTEIKTFRDKFFSAESGQLPKFKFEEDNGDNIKDEWKSMITELRDIITTTTILCNDLITSESSSAVEYTYKKSIATLYNLERYNLTEINQLEKSVKRFLLSNKFLSIIALVLAFCLDFLSVLIGYFIKKLTTKKSDESNTNIVDTNIVDTNIVDTNIESGAPL